MEYFGDENRSGAANAMDGFVIMPRRHFHQIVTRLHQVDTQSQVDSGSPVPTGYSEGLCGDVDMQAIQAAKRSTRKPKEKAIDLENGDDTILEPYKYGILNLSNWMLSRNVFINRLFHTRLRSLLFSQEDEAKWILGAYDCATNETEWGSVAGCL